MVSLLGRLHTMRDLGALIDKNCNFWTMSMTRFTKVTICWGWL